jgi:hypothetical protein
MAARMGAVTGKGLSDPIREEFGRRATFFTMHVLGLADLGNIAAEFEGIASGLGIFGISKYICVPLGAVLVWLVVVYGSYKYVERILWWNSSALSGRQSLGCDTQGIALGWHAAALTAPNPKVVAETRVHPGDVF